jgi:hypothetical protein
MLLLEEHFDSRTFNPLWTSAGFLTDLYDEHGVSGFGDVDGHESALHYYIAEGTDELTPASVGVEGDDEFLRVTGRANAEEFYLEWNEFFEEDYDFAEIGQKLLRFTYWKTEEERGLELTFGILNNNDRIQLFLYHPYGREDGSVLDLGLDYQHGVALGRWVQFGVWCRMNTPGESDGFVRVYMDGEEIISQDEMSLRGTDSRGWNIMWLGGNYSNIGPTATSSSRYIDDIRWYSTKPD